MDIKLREFDDYSHPRQRPWIVAGLIVVLVGGFFSYRYFSHRQHARQAPVVTTEAAMPDVRPVPSNAPAVVVPPQPRRQPPQAAAQKPQAGTTASAPAVPSVTKPATRTAPTRRTGGISAQDLVAKGIAFEQAGNLVNARQAYADAVINAVDPGLKADAEQRLGDVNMKILFSPTMIPEKITYTVRPGDRLESIARRVGTTPELAAAGNRLPDGNMIRAGDELRLLTAKFSLEVTKSKHEMVLLMDSAFCKRYQVGIGAFDKTPVGSFTITTKQTNPVWYRRDGPPVPFGDEKNILGTRWMSIQDAQDPRSDRRGLGIHGTADETTIGKSLSAGCVRMRNKDVEELYALVPIGTKVRIAE